MFLEHHPMITACNSLWGWEMFSSSWVYFGVLLVNENQIVVLCRQPVAYAFGLYVIWIISMVDYVNWSSRSIVIWYNGGDF